VATNIYAAAYNRNQQTRDFYEFLKTLDAYKATIDNQTTLILSTDGEFYKWLKRTE